VTESERMSCNDLTPMLRFLLGTNGTNDPRVQAVELFPNCKGRRASAAGTTDMARPEIVYQTSPVPVIAGSVIAHAGVFCLPIRYALADSQASAISRVSSSIKYLVIKFPWAPL
jgi:hypothetical protein